MPPDYSPCPSLPQALISTDQGRALLLAKHCTFESRHISMGFVLRASIPRASESESQSKAWTNILQNSFETLSGTTHLPVDEAVALLLARGAARVKDTTPPLVRVQEHDNENVAPAFEAAMGLPLLTVAGNLNCVPELIAIVSREVIADFTLRRRLVLYQDATGEPPPSMWDRYLLDGWPATRE